MNTDDLVRPMENKEWYQEYMGDIAEELSSHYAELLREALKKIVAEAERRGKVKAWEEIAQKANEMDTEGSTSFVDSYRMSWRNLRRVIDAKINELKGALVNSSQEKILERRLEGEATVIECSVMDAVHSAKYWDIKHPEMSDAEKCHWAFHTSMEFFLCAKKGKCTPCCMFNPEHWNHVCKTCNVYCPCRGNKHNPQRTHSTTSPSRWRRG